MALVTAELLDYALTAAFGQPAPKYEWRTLAAEEARGFNSSIVRVQILEQDDRTLPRSVIVKVPNIAKNIDNLRRAAGKGDGEEILPESDEKRMVLHVVHDIECEAYRLFEKYGNLGILAPKSYHVESSQPSTQPLVVMEDFADAKTLDIIENLNQRQLEQIVDQIARIQVFGALHFVECRDRLGFSEEDQKLMPEMTAMVKNSATQSATKFPDLLEDLKTYVDEVFDESSRPFRMPLGTEFKKLENPQGNKSAVVLCHGDMWAEQLLFTESDTNQLHGIVDWQLAHIGSPAEDLYRLLALGLDENERKRLTRPMFQRLHEKVVEIGKEHGLDEIYSWQQLENSYVAFAPTMLGFMALASVMLPETPTLKKGRSVEEDEQRAMAMRLRVKAIVDEALEIAGNPAGGYVSWTPLDS